ncbi:MAG: CTP synthase, partial [Planctomycetes bacterium]|nr:CTP synthase [Planctomycetota bacterium]
PSQHSVAHLRQIGIQPDVLICRTEQALEEGMHAKLSLFCNVPRDAVIEERDVETSIYEVPLMLRDKGLDDLIVRRLQLPSVIESNMDDWRDMIDIIRNATEVVEIAVCGKYIQLNDSYKSIYEALAHAGIANRIKVTVRKVDSELVERDGPEAHLEGCHGLLIPGGFGKRGIEGKIAAVRYVRERGIPFFGICLGLQVAVIEFARHVAGIAGADSTEFKPGAAEPVIDLMEEQKEVEDMGGTMRLGAYPCSLVPGTMTQGMYGQDLVSERHRHRFEVNNQYRRVLGQHGLVFAGLYRDKDLVEIVELPDHPWFVGVQFHPEFQSKPLRAHPIFKDFVRATVMQKNRSSSAVPEEAPMENDVK